MVFHTAITYVSRALELRLSVVVTITLVDIVIDQLLFELDIDPQNAYVECKDREGEDAILVVGQVHGGFHEEHDNSEDARYYHLSVEIDVGLVLLVFLGLILIVVGAVLPYERAVRVDGLTLTDSRHRHHHRKVHRVGDPGIDCREGHVDGQEVGEGNDVASVVLVLEGLVDQVLHHELEDDERDEWQDQGEDILKFVEEDETGHGDCECKAQPAEGKTELEEQAILIVLARVEAREASDDEDALKDEQCCPAETFDLILHLKRDQWQDVVVRDIGRIVQA